MAMYSVSIGGDKSYFWGRYAPVKKRPQNPVPLTDNSLNPFKA
jgi:hypothetical protein